MKAIITSLLFLCLLTTPGVYAQNIPQTINYQAIAHTTKGKAIANTDIIVEIGIIKGSINGSLEYQETHSVKTNDYGLFNLQIGSGLPTFAGNQTNFSQINWTNDIYFLKVRIDFGTDEFLNGLIDIGTFQFQSVPYALASKKAEVANSVLQIPEISLNDLNDVDTSSALDNQLLAWDADLQMWVPADPTGDTGVYLRTDGTADLTENWTISTKNITLNSGNLYINSGTLFTKTLSVNSGTIINEISTDATFSGNSDNAIPTEKAVKTYVDASVNAWQTTTNYIYSNDTRNIGIGTSTPSHKFEVNLGSEEGFLISGIFSGNIPDLNSGTRMSFYPAKAAFRAGRIENQSDYWNNNNVGNYSAGFGYDTKASGDYSFVSGRDNQAIGLNSFVTGRNNVASNSYAAIFGRDNTVAGIYSFVSGRNNSTTGLDAFVSGYNNSSNADYSFTTGIENIADSYAETVLGTYNYSVTSNSSAWVDDDALFSVGNGTSSLRSNALIVLKNGNTGIGLGQSSPTYMLEVGKPGDGTEARANAWNTLSDKRLKTNIQIINNSQEKLNKINGYYYFWKTGKDRSRQLGVLAQEIESVLPEIVSSKNGGYKSVDYSKLTVLLIEVVKSQQKRINVLENYNKKVIKQIENLNIKLKNHLKTIH